jgi:hypothetical protein
MADRLGVLSSRARAANPRVDLLEIANIRKDGGTQHRLAVDQGIVAEYASLMLEGVVFPPVRVWYDGTNYWLTDGFQRLAAAERDGRTCIDAEIWQGTHSEAQWDSYGANSCHGLRRTQAEIGNVIRSALQHPAAAFVSNVEIAKHLGVPEATLRRWRSRLSLPLDRDPVRIAKRKGREYAIRVGKIGKKRTGRAHAKSMTDLRAELEEMKPQASPNARRILNVFGNWAFGRATVSDCLEAIEIAIRELTRPAQL